MSAMVLDKYAAERSRFHRLIGVNDVGLGLPVGATDDDETRTLSSTPTRGSENETAVSPDD